MRFTDEQELAIDSRDGDLLLDAGAGSGKTSVLVERFALGVRDDGIDPSRILAITFTEKAAAELRERVRLRLRALGCEARAREAEGAWISTIHGFCARVLRAHALAAGLDPGFTVLEAYESAELAAAAFDGALAAVAATEDGAALIAAHPPAVLRHAVASLHEQLRADGRRHPTLPPLPASQRAAGGGVPLLAAAHAVQHELGALPDPGLRVSEALAMLERAREICVERLPWPGELDSLALGRGAAALRSDTCERYREALAELRRESELVAGAGVRDALDALLQGYGARYAEAKAARSAVDFADLELLAREVLAMPEVGQRYRDRFVRVMVDEMQDTNRVQLELIDLVAAGNLFMVGDAQQSIYGFRGADVELFERRGHALAEHGRRASLTTNFRSRGEVLSVLNAAFGRAIGPSFRPLGIGRVDPPAPGPRVELLIVDKTADWESDEGLASPWRAAEARGLAARVRALIDAGEGRAGDVVVLTRATTDLRVYERALEAAGVPTYVIGGRGYWGHPQVVELVAYVRALANPLDDESWYATLVSRLCGLSLDGLVLLAAGARGELTPEDEARLGRFETWFAGERAVAARLGAEELIDRAVATTGYEREIVALPGGRRRLANVRKLMRLAREWEASAGSDLAGFLDFIALRASGADGARESEAPVESEALDAVRLMTIHRSKGLEFPIVCVADLGRTPRTDHPLVRIGRDGHRLGLTLREPGTGPLTRALDYNDLAAEQRERERAEERRLFYVAMTRAKERLIVSGAARPTLWEAPDPPTPIGWIAPALVPDMAARLVESDTFVAEGVAVRFVADPLGAADALGAADPAAPAGRERRLHGVFLDPHPAEAPPTAPAGRETRLMGGKVDPHSPTPAPAPAQPAPPPLTTLSYTALSDYRRCGYRFYVQRVLGLPETRPPDEEEPRDATRATTHTPGGAARGTAVHALLQSFDFGRGGAALPPDTPQDLRNLVEAFAASSTGARLRAATGLRREQPFAFPFADLLITGVFDVIATESGGRLLVLDYKSDRIADHESPDALTTDRYQDQRTVYALAALRTGARSVETIHLFLERPNEPVIRSFDQTDLPRLEHDLHSAAEPLLNHAFPVATDPHRHLCQGCPAAGTLCPWPIERTSRPRPPAAGPV